MRDELSDSAESVTSNATATTIKFKLVDANSPVGTVSCVWAMHGSPWPNQHSSKGTVSFSLTGEGVSSSVSGSKLNRDVTHGVLMVLAWVIFMPFGSASTTWKRLLPERWFYVHVSLVGAGSVLFAIALCLLIGRDDRAKDSKVDTHYSLAIAVISLWLIQLSLGALRPNKKPEDGARLGCIPAALRPAWFWAHRLIAPTVLTVAAATIFVGADLMHDRYGTRDSTGVSFLRPGVLGARVRRRRRRRRRRLLRPDETTRGVDERPRTRVNPSRSFIHIFCTRTLHRTRTRSIREPNLRPARASLVRAGAVPLFTVHDSSIESLPEGTRATRRTPRVRRIHQS